MLGIKTAKTVCSLQGFERPLLDQTPVEGILARVEYGTSAMHIIVTESNILKGTLEGLQTRSLSMWEKGF